MSTVFIGGSALLLAGSALALAFGFKSADETLMWTSIAAAVGAAVFLVAAYLVARREAATRVSAGGEVTTGGSDSQPAATLTEGNTEGSREETGARTGVDGPTTARSAAPATATGPITARSKRSGAGAPAASKPSGGGSSGEVVAIPDRKRYHLPECRYAKAKGAERMTRAAARRKSYAACGVCKP